MVCTVDAGTNSKCNTVGLWLDRLRQSAREAKAFCNHGRSLYHMCWASNGGRTPQEMWRHMTLSLLQALLS